MRACCSRSTSARRADPPLSWLQVRSTPFRCCSAASAACCGWPFRAAISRREDPMLTRRVALTVAALLLSAGAASAQEKLKAVATFSILADLVKNVGGDRVEMQALVGPNADAHVYQPSPGDAKALADAKVIFTNGLGFEGWIARLIKASGTKAPMVIATKSVKPRKMDDEGHAETDPHAWQSVPNAKIYVA